MVHRLIWTSVREKDPHERNLLAVTTGRNGRGRAAGTIGRVPLPEGAAVLTLLFLVPLAVATPPSRAAQGAVPTVEDVVRVTQLAADDIVVAGGQEMVVKPDADFTGVRESFRAGRRGVWCTGAARYLMGVASTHGWQTRRLDIGRRGSSSTHSVVLVKTRRGWLASDPYLGRVILDPYPLAVNKVRRGERPSAVSFGANRRTVYSRKAVTESDGNLEWIAGRKTPRPTPCSETATTVVCRVQHDVHDYENLWHYAPEMTFYAGLDGLAGTIDSGLATPFALTAPSTDGKPQNEDYQLIEKPEDVLELTNSPPLWAFS